MAVEAIGHVLGCRGYRVWPWKLSVMYLGVGGIECDRGSYRSCTWVSILFLFYDFAVGF